MEQHVSQLTRLGFVREAENTEWVSAPLIISKKPLAIYRLDIDYSAVNAATLKEKWPMPQTDAVRSEERGSKAFTGIDFCSGYWQLPLNSDSKAMNAFMTPDGVVQNTRATQGGCNIAANFQACVNPCFPELREHTLPWLDDFVLHASKEKDILLVLRDFFQAFRERNRVV